MPYKIEYFHFEGIKLIWKKTQLKNSVEMNFYSAGSKNKN